MDRFAYYLDFGSGWVEVNPFENDLVWSNENEITPAINRIKLTGTVIFIGSEYDDIITFRDTGQNYIALKIEQYSNISDTWNDIFEGNFDLRGKFNENEKTIELKKSNSDSDVYDEILANYTTKYDLTGLGLTSRRIMTPVITSVTTDCVKQPNALSVAAYKVLYDIDGYLSYTGFVDPRWAYFLFRSTDGDGSHNFETMAFRSQPDESFSYTKIRMVISGIRQTMFVKLPPGIASTETIQWPIADTYYRFPDVIDALLANTISGITFTEGTAVTYVGQFDGIIQYSYFDYTVYQIGQALELANSGDTGAQISFKNVLDIMQDAFNLFWYIDGTALKFKHATELLNVGSLDLTSETQYLTEVEYIEGLIPDLESFQTKDTEGVYIGPTGKAFGTVEIYYREDKFDLSNFTKKINPINIYTNPTYVQAGKGSPDKNDFALLETTDNISDPRICYGTYPYLNSRLASAGLFGHLNAYRFDDKAQLATGFKFGWLPLLNMNKRPLLKLEEIDYNIDLLTDYDMLNAIITTVGTGKTKKISQKLSEDHAQIIVEL